MTAVFLAPLYLLVNGYLFWRIMGWVQAWFPGMRPKQRWILPAVIYAFFALSFLTAFLLPEGSLRRKMKLLGNGWLGVLCYLFLTVLTADGLRLLFRRIHCFQKILCCPWLHRLAGCVCAVLILLSTVLGTINAHTIYITPYEITVEKSVGTLDAMKIVLLSDLHLGYNIGIKQMEQMVEKVNAQQPDLVVIAGDIFDNEWEAVEQPPRLAEILRGIRSRWGVYACYGNHDVEEPILAGFTFSAGGEKTSSPEMDEFLQQAGIRLLRDESVEIGEEICLYGRPDAKKPGRGIGRRKTPEELTKGIDPEKLLLVLDHQPRELEELARAGVDVDLSGHTHDGQMFPGNLLVRLLWENPYGYQKVGNMHSFVTSGVGVFGPDMRVGTKAEICVITLRFAKTGRG